MLKYNNTSVPSSLIQDDLRKERLQVQVIMLAFAAMMLFFVYLGVSHIVGYIAEQNTATVSGPACFTPSPLKPNTFLCPAFGSDN